MRAASRALLASARERVAPATLLRSACVAARLARVISVTSSLTPEALATIRVATSARIAARNASMEASASATTDAGSAANDDPAPNAAASRTSAKKSFSVSSSASTARATRGRAVPFGATRGGVVGTEEPNVVASAATNEE